MQKLDRALFWGEFEGCPWPDDELRKLSRQGARFKESSAIFPDSPFSRSFRTQLSPNVVLLLDPLGESVISDLRGATKPAGYSFGDVKLLMALLADDDSILEDLRLQEQRTTREWDKRISWAVSQLANFGLKPSAWYRAWSAKDSILPNAEITPQESTAATS